MDASALAAGNPWGMKAAGRLTNHWPPGPGRARSSRQKPRQGSDRLSSPRAAEFAQSIYRQLHAIARKRLAGRGSGHTLQPTALVSESWLKLRDHFDTAEPSPAFFRTAAEAMRQVLIDHARGKARVKRGGGAARRELADVAQLAAEDDPDQILALDEALRRLEQQDPDAARDVKLRFYAGLSVEETAAVLGVSERTVKRDWQFARAWLYRVLE